MLVAILFSLFALCFGSSVFVSPPCGPLSGLSDGLVDSFLGIPFGEAERFEMATAHSVWRTVFNATSLPPPCLQGLDSNPAKKLPGSVEKCLYINVWRPAMKSSSANDKRNVRIVEKKQNLLPVLFWIYGGGWTTGFSADHHLLGDKLAAKGRTVVVSFNYRVSSFGWIAGRGFSGNYGLSDQVLALQWVQQNIAAFGGDPKRVTIFGQSAGGMSVNVHMTSPRSWGLFSRAISESSAPGLHYRRANESDQYVDQILTQTGCFFVPDPVKCLKGKPADEILAVSGGQVGIIQPPFLSNVLRWMPVIDDKHVLGSPLQQFLKGASRPNTPYLMGSVANETYGFIFNWDLPRKEYEAALLAYFGENFGAVWDLYGAATDADVKDALTRFSSDGAFHCPIRRIANATGARLYSLLHPPSKDPFNPIACWGKYACHSAELSYIFDHTDGLSRTPDEQQLAAQMQNIWLDFATGGSLSWWPSFSFESTQQVAFVTPKLQMINGLYEKLCKVIDKVLG
jgi:para-nitrobenzyl esterase